MRCLLQVAALDKQYTALQKQYDAAVQSHEKLLGIHAGLRKERDELWAEADRLRRQLSEVEAEKGEVVLKLNALRGEVKFTMDEVMQDRCVGLGRGGTREARKTGLAEAAVEGGRSTSLVALPCILLPVAPRAGRRAFSRWAGSMSRLSPSSRRSTRPSWQRRTRGSGVRGGRGCAGSEQQRGETPHASE